jgi:hypothetical protein
MIWSSVKLDRFIPRRLFDGPNFNRGQSSGQGPVPLTVLSR